MYKLFVVSCLIASAFAAPSHSILEPALKTVSIHSEVPIVKTTLVHEPALKTIQEHTIEKVGEHVESIPTAVSHQSQTIVHSKADKITPILAPSIKTSYIPTVNTYAKQFVEKVPVVQSYVAPTVLKSYAAPALIKSYEAPALYRSYESPALIKSYDTPLIKSYSAPALIAKSYSSPLIYKSYAAPSLYSQW